MMAANYQGTFILKSGTQARHLSGFFVLRPFFKMVMWR